MAIKYLETDPQISHVFNDKEPKWVDNANKQLDIMALYEFYNMREATEWL